MEGALLGAAPETAGLGKRGCANGAPGGTYSETLLNQRSRNAAPKSTSSASDHRGRRSMSFRSLIAALSCARSRARRSVDQESHRRSLCENRELHGLTFSFESLESSCPSCGMRNNDPQLCWDCKSLCRCQHGSGVLCGQSVSDAQPGQCEHSNVVVLAEAHCGF